MINKYKYTKDIIEEYQKAWWNNEYRVGNISMAVTSIAALFLLINGIKTGEGNIFSKFLIILPVLYFPAFFIKKNKFLKKELKTYSKTYRNKQPEIEIKIEDKIQISLNNEKIEVTYDKIKKYIETKNLIIIKMKDNTTISLKKDSFIDATAEECKELLKEKLKRKNKRKIRKERYV